MQIQLYQNQSPLPVLGKGEGRGIRSLNPKVQFHQGKRRTRNPSKNIHKKKTKWKEDRPPPKRKESKVPKTLFGNRRKGRWRGSRADTASFRTNGGKEALTAYTINHEHLLSSNQMTETRTQNPRRGRDEWREGKKGRERRMLLKSLSPENT